MKWRLIAGAASTALLLGSCNSGSSLSQQASGELSAQVQAVRAAALGHDRPLVASRLSQLQTEVSQLRQSGQITGSKASAILVAISAVQAQLGTIPNPPPPPTTQPPPPGPGKHGKDHGGGGDGGNGGGD